MNTYIYREREREREYSVKRSIERVLGDLFLELVPESRSEVVDRKRHYPIPARH